MTVETPPAAGPRPGERWRDRAVPLAAIAAVTAIAWGYLAVLAHGMAGMDAMAASGGSMALSTAPRPWTLADGIAMLAMWWVMMAAMMLPSATPMILTVATVNRRRRARGEPSVATALFAAGYLIAWGGFSAAATAAQWGLEEAALLSSMMAASSPMLGGALLVAAGLYQLTPLKHACLRHCRSPFDFVLNRWRDGAGGALAMGVEHGLYCLGCCWAMMALLFVFGVMNLIWIAALSVLVLAEKAVPGGPWIARAGGIAMAVAGAGLLAAPYLAGSMP